jgi:hypothetical protein
MLAIILYSVILPIRVTAQVEVLRRVDPPFKVPYDYV